PRAGAQVARRVPRGRYRPGTPGAARRSAWHRAAAVPGRVHARRERREYPRGNAPQTLRVAAPVWGRRRAGTTVGPPSGIHAAHRRAGAGRGEDPFIGRLAVAVARGSAAGVGQLDARACGRSQHAGFPRQDRESAARRAVVRRTVERWRPTAARPWSTATG